MLTVSDLVERRLWDADEPLLMVALDGVESDPAAVDAAVIAARTAVLVGVTSEPRSPLAETMDVVLPPGDVEALDAIRRTVESSPIASLCLTGLLRITAVAPPEQGLVAESFAYSTLLAGPEHARWLAARPPRRSTGSGTVHVSRSGDRLDVVLADPARRNAFSRQMRDELVAALSLVDADDTITSVHLRGDGPAFCSGGDLDEFGTTPDPATAHVIRTTRSVPALLLRHSARVHAEVHGACIGAGVELPAFAGRVTARPDAVFHLPEVTMGLIPGAGGTVSLTRRIGRQRTAYLALSGRRLDAPTALQWGLVDELDP